MSPVGTFLSRINPLQGTDAGSSTVSAGATSPAAPTPPPAPTPADVPVAPPLPDILANAPAPQPVAPMPDPSSPAVMEAARRAQQQTIGAAGRQSTILTTIGSRASAPRPAGGTGDYSKSTLAAG